MTKGSSPTKPTCILAGTSELGHPGKQLTSMTSHSSTSEASSLLAQGSRWFEKRLCTSRGPPCPGALHRTAWWTTVGVEFLHPARDGCKEPASMLLDPFWAVFTFHRCTDFLLSRVMQWCVSLCPVISPMTTSFHLVTPLGPHVAASLSQYGGGGVLELPVAWSHPL